MSQDKNENAAENFDLAYLQLIKGANRILNTLELVWKHAVSVLLISLSAVGAFSIAFYFVESGRQIFLTEGIIFIAIAAWVFARNFFLGCNQCCTVDIPRWRRTLAAFVTAEGKVDKEREGESVAESLMHVIDASGDWIRLIKRDVFSLLFWPIVAAAAFAASVYSVDATLMGLIGAIFAIYIGALVIAVTLGVSFAFRKWQRRIAKFKDAMKTAMEVL